MRFPLTREPYTTYALNRIHNAKFVPVCDDDLNFDSEFVLDLVKASGLKSNKKRHIRKRFNIVMNDIIREGLAEWQKRNSK